MKGSFFAIVLIFFTAVGSAQQPQQWFSTGAEFLSFCVVDSPPEQPTVNATLCVAYMRGYVDSMVTTERVLRTILEENFRWTVCLPAAAQQPILMIKTVRTWLERHPEALKQSIAPIVMAAFHDSFPCSTG